jgi:hypothetical protein
MHQTYLLIVTALGEGATGLFLLAWPPLPLRLLLGIDAAAETLAVARIAGAALLALSLACWPRRADAPAPPRGLLIGVLIYDVAAAAILAYTGWFLQLVGIALWPAVVAHALLAAWCAACLVDRSGGGTPASTGADALGAAKKAPT